MADRAIAAAQRMDDGIVHDVQAVRVVISRRSRPIVAVAANTADTATITVAITRSRVPYSVCRAEPAGEVHSRVGAVV